MKTKNFIFKKQNIWKLYNTEIKNYDKILPTEHIGIIDATNSENRNNFFTQILKKLEKEDNNMRLIDSNLNQIKFQTNEIKQLVEKQQETKQLENVEDVTKTAYYKRNFIMTTIEGVKNFHLTQIQSKNLMTTFLISISVKNGPNLQFKEQISVFKMAQSKKLIIYLNEYDLLNEEESKEYKKIIMEEIEEILKNEKIDLSKVQFFEGNLNETVKMNELLEYLTNKIKLSEYEPFIISVESCQISTNGCLISGKCQQGVLNENDAVDVVGALEADYKSVALGVTPVKRNSEENITSYFFQFPVVLNNIKGFLISSPNFAKKSKNLKANIFFLQNERKKIIKNNEKLEFQMFSNRINGTIKMKDNFIFQDDLGGVEIILDHISPVYKNMPFTIIHENNQICYGRVVDFEVFKSWREKFLPKLLWVLMVPIILIYMLFMNDVFSSIWKDYSK
eukprot:gene6191-10198_t